MLGAGAGAGAAVPAVAVQAGWSLLGPSWRNRASAVRWAAYLAAGLAAAATIGAWLVLVLLGCGAVELLARHGPRLAAGTWTTGGDGTRLHGFLAAPALVLAAGGGVLASVAWVAFKVGGLSFGGGFVIIPLMQADAVSHYHWMTGAQFLNAVALGQVTPGPVVQTVAVVGYAAAGLAGGLLASAVAFTPSFLIVLFGGPRFERIRGNQRARAFLDGAGPAAIGAILGSAITLTRELIHPWQYVVLAGALAAAAPAAPRRRPHPAVRRRDRRHRRPGRRHRLPLTKTHPAVRRERQFAARTYDVSVTTGAVVLAGGRSSRMGTPKAALEWHGSTLLRRTVGILARATDGPVVVVRASGQDLPALPKETIVVDDPRDGKGPVQGIAAGLAALAGQAGAAFVTSTDLPFLHPAFVGRVLRVLGSPATARTSRCRWPAATSSPWPPPTGSASPSSPSASSRRTGCVPRSCSPSARSSDSTTPPCSPTRRSPNSTQTSTPCSTSTPPTTTRRARRRPAPR